MSSISEKQTQIELLQQQLLSLTDELVVLEKQNPEYKKTFSQLQTQRANINVLLSTVDTIILSHFVEFKCAWQGIEMYPEIISFNFLNNEAVNSLFTRIFIEYDNTDEIFDIDDPQIRAVLEKHELYDKKILNFNNTVEASFVKFKEVKLKELLLP